MSVPAGLYSMFEFEEVCEDEGDCFGRVMGFHIAGHVDFADVELFMAAVEYEELARVGQRGFDVKHCWVRKVPCEYGQRYQYQNFAQQGARAVTVIEEETTWEKRCVVHPFEVAKCGVPKESVINGEALADERGYVHFCKPCHEDFDVRQKAAAKKRYDELMAERLVTA